MTIGIEYVSEMNVAAGCVFSLISFFIAKDHAGFHQFLKTFPRSRFWGILLTGAALLWSAIMIDNMTLGDLSKYKWLLYILTPLSFYLVIQFLDELLASRAFGGLLMLAPVVMVDAARWHPSPWRLAIITLAYIMVISGIWLMLCPFKFRIWVDAITADNRRKISSAVYLTGAILLFAAAWFTR